MYSWTIYANVDSPFPGFPYFNFLWGLSKISPSVNCCFQLETKAKRCKLRLRHISLTVSEEKYIFWKGIEAVIRGKYSGGRWWVEGRRRETNLDQSDGSIFPARPIGRLRTRASGPKSYLVHHLTILIVYRSLGALRAPTSTLRHFGPP